MRELCRRIHGLRPPINYRGPSTPHPRSPANEDAALRMTEDLYLSASSVQLLPQQLIHHLRIRLAFGSFHYLSDEKTHDCLLPCAVLLDLFGVGRDNLVNDFLQYRSVTGLFRTALFFVDGGEIFSTLEGQVVEVFEPARFPRLSLSGVPSTRSAPGWQRASDSSPLWPPLRTGRPATGRA
jgi:hypothetical protein